MRHKSLIGGRTTFRKYDNDSEARRRGTYELTSARRLWTRADMTAITKAGSALHLAVDAFCRRPRECIDLLSPPRPAPGRRTMGPWHACNVTWHACNVDEVVESDGEREERLPLRGRSWMCGRLVCCVDRVRSEHVFHSLTLSSHEQNSCQFICSFAPSVMI